jgi:hypothetical protein
MSNETFGGLVWNSPAGVLAQTVELTAHRDPSKHSDQTEASATGSRETKLGSEWFRIPMPAAAAGLVFLGFILGTTLVVTIIS